MPNCSPKSTVSAVPEHMKKPNILGQSMSTASVVPERVCDTYWKCIWALRVLIPHVLIHIHIRISFSKMMIPTEPLTPFLLYVYAHFNTFPTTMFWSLIIPSLFPWQDVLICNMIILVDPTHHRPLCLTKLLPRALVNVDSLSLLSPLFVIWGSPMIPCKLPSLFLQV